MGPLLKKADSAAKPIFDDLCGEWTQFDRTAMELLTIAAGMCACGRTTLQHMATHCNTLQHTATQCNTLQHSAMIAAGMCACGGASVCTYMHVFIRMYICV